MAAYPKADFSVTLDGRDLTGMIEPRLVNMTLTESRGDEADTLDLVLDDGDGRLALPRTGAVLAVSIGWAGEGLVDKGTFTVDEVGHTGTPDTITITARSASLTHQLGGRKERSWHGKTLGQIVRTIAGEHKLQPVVGKALGVTAVPHIDQTHESDLAFLTRLAKRYDAVMTVKDKRLLFMPIGEATTASGRAMPTLLIERSSGDRHSYRAVERERYQGVRAYWHSGPHGKRESVRVGGEDNRNLKTLPETYASAGEARDAAAGEWKRLQRGEATMSYSLALGRADIIPETPTTVSGFKAEIDATEWLVKRVSHTIDQAGFVTNLELETRKGRESSSND